MNMGVTAFQNCYIPTLERLRIGGSIIYTDHEVHSLLLGCPALVYLYAEEFEPSDKFVYNWEKIGRNRERAWEAPLELVCRMSLDFVIGSCGRPVEVRDYLEEIGLAWKLCDVTDVYRS